MFDPSRSATVQVVHTRAYVQAIEIGTSRRRGRSLAERNVGIAAGSS